MDFREFLDLAFDLLAGSREADWRSAVSRAYYAACHVAAELLEDLGFAVAGGDRAHGYLWLRLSNCGDANTVLAGRNLQLVRRERNRADYEGRRPLHPLTARRLVQTAEGIILALDSPRSQPTRTTITDAMKHYERVVLQEVTWHP